MKNTSIALLVSLLVAPSLAAARTPHQRVSAATEVLESLLQGADRPPSHLLDATTCLLVVPRLIKGALGFGGRRGKGVIACRSQGGGWNPPAFVKISGASFGFQIGGQSTELVLLIVNERSVRSLLKSKFTIGVDASLAAGPRSYQALASTDIRLDAEIYSYATSKGLFVGAAVEGARVALDRKSIAAFYDSYLRPEDILFGRTDVTVPPEGRSFVATLP